MADDVLKQTPLSQLHMDAGAKMGGFAGYTMPLFYPLGLMKEHLHTRAACGLFDISHMVHINVEGPQAAQLIERACPYAASSQVTGSCRYTFFLNDNAGILDDLIITRLGDNQFRIVANAGCAEKDIAHIKVIAMGFDAAIAVLPSGFIALQGPKAETVLTEQGFDVGSMAFMSAIEPRPGWFLTRSGYTGEDGFEIAMPVEETESFASTLHENPDVELVGLGARDSLRLEAGLSLYGQDLSEDISPHEAGLIWAIAKELRQGGPYIGAASLAEKFAAGRNRMRVGLLPKEKIPVRGGASLDDGNANPVGVITSGGFGPSFDGPVALGLIEVAAKDGPIFAEVRGRKIEMVRAKLPFVTHRYKR